MILSTVASITVGKFDEKSTNFKIVDVVFLMQQFSKAYNGLQRIMLCMFGVSLFDRQVAWAFLHRVSIDNHILCLSRQDGRSSLMYASKNGHVEVVDKLLQHGATVDLQNVVHTLYVHMQCKQTRVQNVISEQ